MTLPQLLAIAAGVASIFLVLIDNEHIVRRKPLPPPPDATDTDTLPPVGGGPIRIQVWDGERYIQR